MGVTKLQQSGVRAFIVRGEPVLEHPEIHVHLRSVSNETGLLVDGFGQRESPETEARGSWVGALAMAVSVAQSGRTPIIDAGRRNGADIEGALLALDRAGISTMVVALVPSGRSTGRGLDRYQQPFTSKLVFGDVVLRSPVGEGPARTQKAAPPTFKASLLARRHGLGPVLDTASSSAFVVMLRHGAIGRLERGDEDPGEPTLSARGRAQAMSAARGLVAFRPDLLLSSPMVRAARTAEILSECFGLPVRYDERLAEAPSPWEKAIAGVDARGTATHAQLGAAALRDAVTSGSRRCVAVTHGWLHSRLLAAYLGIPVDEAWRLELGTGRLSLMQLNAGGDFERLVVMNADQLPAYSIDPREASVA